MARKSKGRSPAARGKATRPRHSEPKSGGDTGAARLFAGAIRATGTLLVLPFSTRRSTEWTLTIVLIGAMIGCWFALKPTLQERIAITHADPVTVQMTVPSDPANPEAVSPWIPGPIIDWMTRMVLERATNHAFATDDLDAARNALLSTGWLHNDLTLRRQPRGVIRVHGSWRRPTAIVHDGNDRYLIAQDTAPLLVPVGFPVPATAYTIRNPSNPPPRRDVPGAMIRRIEIAYGEPWPGADVRAAIDLLALLDASPVRAQVAGIDLSDYVADQHLVIVTDTGSRIVWGSPPNPDGTPVAPEVPIAERLRRLEAFLNTHRRIDAGHALLLVYTPTVQSAIPGPRTARP